jgi:alkylation response protein AidB-like acyl-CoA dehydrogenase
MEWSIPEETQQLLVDLDEFIEREIKPLEEADPDLFDHRREFARTDLERGGIPTERWRAKMLEARRRAVAAGFYKLPLPASVGGSELPNLTMAIVREHLTKRGPGLHAELSHEASVVANAPLVLVLDAYGTEEQKAEYLQPLASGEIEMAFGLTEPGHGSDATYLETTAKKVDGGWVINGTKRWNSVVDVAAANLVFARTGGEHGKADGITAFLVPKDTPGYSIPYYHWTFAMPTDHGETVFQDVHLPDSAVVGEVGRGLDCAQLFVHENRIRQAASSLGAAQFCIDESVKYAKERVIFGTPLAEHQGVQWQLVELQTEAELVRNTVHKTAWLMDQGGRTSVSDLVSMVNFRGNNLACDAADRAMQVHGGVGYSRHKPFEAIYRHHRRYRITEGSDELQKRRIAGKLFGLGGKKAAPEAPKPVAAD